MNFNIFVGIFISIMAIFFGAPDVRKDIGAYWAIDAFILVFLGTIGSTLISVSFRDFNGVFKILGLVFFGKKKFLTSFESIEAMISIAEEAQSASRQSLPEKVKGKKDQFLMRSLDMVAGGLDKDFILQTLETDIEELRNRHSKKIVTIRTMGSFAPMFGMAGTVMGVIQVLKNVSDIDNIVAGMALALLTTLYGLFFTSILFIPLSNKLKDLSEEEILSKQVIMQGVEMVLDKEIPLKVEKYLTAFLNSNDKDKFAKKK